MKLKRIAGYFSVCKIEDPSLINRSSDLYFLGKTDEELSLICKTEDIPLNTLSREDGWQGFRIQEILDFSLIGILSRISGILADSGIGIFAVSTFNTDYFFIKSENFKSAQKVLENNGYFFIE